MDWKTVGDWIKGNAGPGVSLVGSLLTGNVPGAVAAGMALVSSATGSDDPAKALASLQTDPATLVKLRELANANEASIRDHLRDMHLANLQDAQAEQETTAKVTMSGDNSDDVFVKRTRPGQSWCSLFAAFAFIWLHGVKDDVDLYVLGLLLALPWAYAGLRQIGKGVDVLARR